MTDIADATDTADAQAKPQISLVLATVFLAYLGQMTLGPVIAPLAREVGLEVGGIVRVARPVGGGPACERRRDLLPQSGVHARTLGPRSDTVGRRQPPGAYVPNDHRFPSGSRTPASRLP